MSDRRDFPTLADRAKALLANSATFYAAFIASSGQWLVTGGLESVWLLSALSLWLLSLLSAPWFVPPRDALANGIVALCILVTADFSAATNFRSELVTIRWLAAGYCIATIIMALVALFIHDRDQNSPVGRLAFRLTGTFGRAELFYTPPAIVSILGAYQGSYPTIAWLLILWMIFVIARPVERIVGLWRQWQSEIIAHQHSPAVGVIERIDDPNIVRVRLVKRTSWRPGTLQKARQILIVLEEAHTIIPEVFGGRVRL
jgi:uncharacterized protein